MSYISSCPLLQHSGVVESPWYYLYHYLRAKNLPYSIDDVCKVVQGCVVCAEIKPNFYKPPDAQVVKAGVGNLWHAPQGWHAASFWVAREFLPQLTTKPVFVTALNVILKEGTESASRFITIAIPQDHSHLASLRMYRNATIPLIIRQNVIVWLLTFHKK